MPVICGYCKQAMRKGEKLKSHWRDMHIEEFIKLQIWLGKTEDKLRAAILLAGEGMKSASGQANLGPEQFSYPMTEKAIEKQAKFNSNQEDKSGLGS